MTSRILNKSGKYDPQTPPAPESIQVDASQLPQVKPDAYADVDHRDFSTAQSMSRVQQLTMASIAHSRGDAEAAMRWKQTAHAKVVEEENAEAAERMHKMLAPHPPVHINGPLTDVKSDIPWENDEAYLELGAERSELKAKLEAFDHSGSEFTDEYFQISGKVAVLDDKMGERESELRESLAATGAWGPQQDRQIAARSSLTDKATEIAGMFSGGSHGAS